MTSVPKSLERCLCAPTFFLAPLIALFRRNSKQTQHRRNIWYKHSPKVTEAENPNEKSRTSKTNPRTSERGHPNAHHVMPATIPSTHMQ